MEPIKRPGNTPLKFHRNRRYGFSMVYPDWWQEYDIPDGKLFSPGDLDTFISVEARELGTPVTASDLPDLKEGFLAGLRRVPGSRIESQDAYDVGFLVGLEARQLYEGKKRWIRLLYRGDLQVRLVAQGATEQEFSRWLPSFDPAMTGFVFDGGIAPSSEDSVAS